MPTRYVILLLFGLPGSYGGALVCSRLQDRKRALCQAALREGGGDELVREGGGRAGAAARRAKKEEERRLRLRDLALCFE